MNKVFLIGNLGNDPEIRDAGSSKVCAIRIATNESWKDKDGNKQEKTEWHNVELWGAQAEACARHFKKGQRIVIEGKLETQTWEKDGTKHYKTVVRAMSFEFDGGSDRHDSGRQDNSRSNDL